MNKLLCNLFVVLALPLYGPSIAGTVFKSDTSHCRKLLDSHSYTKANAVCTQAAERGNSAAQFNLSVMYSKGLGVDKNDMRSMKWLRASAEQRYPPAEYALASRYAAGSGVTKNRKEALRLLQDAAKQGFILAQMLLGKSYESGYEYLGVEKNLHAAIYWYSQAALGCDACQYELWRIYFFGRGVARNYTKAAGYLKSAAEAGLPKAQMQLAFRYLKGEGVPKDDVQAYMWFYLAEKGGDPLAKNALPILAKRISRAQVAEAKAMAKTIMERPIDSAQLCALYQQFCGR
ncbi:MAG: tetratricopeptide repeat protein [Gammaproteobacteria bacterium]